MFSHIGVTHRNIQFHQVEGGEFENQPIRRTDVIREEDRMDEQELPEVGK